MFLPIRKYYKKLIFSRYCNLYTNIFNLYSKMKGSYVIGVAGGTAAGKTFVCDEMVKRSIENFGKNGYIAILKQDSYYKGGNPDQNYDIPEAIDFPLMIKHIIKLMSGKSIDAPIYNFSTHSRKEETELIKPSKMIIIEGTLIFTQEEILKLCDLKVFISANEATRVFRRLKRDIETRGRTMDEVENRWKKDIESSDEKYIKPSAYHAHIKINNIDNRYEGLDILLNHLINKLRELDMEIYKKYINKNLEKLVECIDIDNLPKIKDLIDKKLVINNKIKIKYEIS